MEERIRKLYQDGKGIKSIAWELEMPASTVRRRLIAMGIYEGVNHNVGQEGEDTNEVEEPETEILPPALDLGEWTARGVSIEHVDSGWRLSFGSGFDTELFSPPLQGEWPGKGMKFSAGLRLIAPAFGSLVMGIRDAGAPFGSEASCLLSSGLISSLWHVKHLCQAAPVLYFKGNSYQATVVHVSGLTLREIPTAGLKPIVPPETKRLEVGTRISLAWQTNNGCRLIRVVSFDRPNAMEINFVSFSGVYAGLPVEVQGKKVRLTLEAMGGGDIEIVLGDSGGSEKKIAFLRREPCTLQLEKDVGREGYVYLNNPSYANFKACLGNAFIEIID